jgi:amino acid permease
MVEKVSSSEIRKTIATSMGAAFGIVIGMIWTNVVMAMFSAANIRLNVGAAGEPVTWLSILKFAIVAIAITLICVIIIVYLGKWGNKPAKGEEKK